MKARTTPVLHYGPTYAADEPPEAAGEPTPKRAPKRALKVDDLATWCVLGVCLVGWSVVGLFLWIPRLVRAVLLFSVALVQSALAETPAGSAGRRLRSAAEFYRRGFATAVEAVRPNAEEGTDDEEGEDEGSSWSIDSSLVLRETMWAIVVWYLILWPLGVIPLTPVGIASSIAEVPWSAMWSHIVDTIAAVPDLIRG